MHPSSNQHHLLKASKEQFLVAGPCFRRDEIDRCHSNIFHQIEGVKLCDDPEQDLKLTLTAMVQSLIPGVECQFSDDHFPFTDPSFEMSILWQGTWLEILGCGVIHSKVLEMAGWKNISGWAFGIGLERLAMVLWGIPDIRLFWSADERFLSQFTNNSRSQFVPFSNQPPCLKDLSFWQNAQVDANELFEVVRDVAGDLIEDVKLIDTFEKAGRTSTCYRMTFRALDRSLTHEEVNLLNMQIRNAVAEQFDIELR